MSEYRAAGPTGWDAVWKKTVDRVKQNVISPGLWRALERSVAVMWEDDVFVIGFAAIDGQMAGLVNSRENQLAIERALREVAGVQDVKVRVIDGTTVQDWAQTKERDAATIAHQQQAVQKRYVEATAFSSWDAVYDQISRLWSGFEYRSLTVGRSRYLDTALDIVVTAMNGGLYPAEGKVDEVTERGLTRVVDRIASMTGSDSVMVGYLLVQKRKAA